jgi:hypothetical protein
MGIISDVASNIFGGFKRVSFGEVDGDPITLDASVREVHSVKGMVSDHPVETGVDVVDHYRVLPREVAIDGIVTDTPIVSGLPGATLVNSAIGFVSSLGGADSPSINAWKEFQRFFDEAVVIEIKTSLEQENYSSMVLTSLDVTRDTDTGQVLAFSAAAREIRFVETEGGAAADPLGALGQAATSAGKKTNSAANASQASSSSALFKIFN